MPRDTLIVTEAELRRCLPLDTAAAWGAPTYAAKACSRACTLGPWVTQPERNTSVTAAP